MTMPFTGTRRLVKLYIYIYTEREIDRYAVNAKSILLVDKLLSGKSVTDMTSSVLKRKHILTIY